MLNMAFEYQNVLYIANFCHRFKFWEHISSICNKKTRLEDNRNCGQLSGDICQGGHLSKNNNFKTYHVGYRWKGLDFKILNLPFILVVYEFKIKRKRKI